MSSQQETGPHPAAVEPVPSPVSEQAPPRQRSARERRPMGRFAGGVVAAVGLLAACCLFAGGPEFFPWYWEPHAPEVMALACGFVMSAGYLMLHGVFSLGRLLAALLAIAALGALGGEVGKRTPRMQVTGLVWHSSKPTVLERIINEGLAETLVERHVFPSGPAPLRAYRDYRGRLCLACYPHADPRVRGMGEAVEVFARKIEGLTSQGEQLSTRRFVVEGNQYVPVSWDPLGERDDYTVAVEYWHAVILKRFGPEAARAVMAKCATLTPNPSFRRSFEYFAGR